MCTKQEASKPRPRHTHKGTQRRKRKAYDQDDVSNELGEIEASTSAATNSLTSSLCLCSSVAPFSHLTSSGGGARTASRGLLGDRRPLASQRRCLRSITEGFASGRPRSSCAPCPCSCSLCNSQLTRAPDVSRSTLNFAGQPGNVHRKYCLGFGELFTNFCPYFLLREVRILRRVT